MFHYLTKSHENKMKQYMFESLKNFFQKKIKLIIEKKSILFFNTLDEFDTFDTLSTIRS